MWIHLFEKSEIVLFFLFCLSKFSFQAFTVTRLPWIFINFYNKKDVKHKLFFYFKLKFHKLSCSFSPLRQEVESSKILVDCSFREDKCNWWLQCPLHCQLYFDVKDPGRCPNQKARVGSHSKLNDDQVNRQQSGQGGNPPVLRLLGDSSI